MPPRRKLVRLSPPHRGIVEGLAYEDHDPSSTVDAQNVRGHDPATGRLRLSQRPGLVNKAASADASRRKMPGGGPIQNISAVSLSDTAPHVVGSECVMIKTGGLPQVLKISTTALVAGTLSGISGEDYQFSVFDRDGNLYVVTIDQTISGSTYAKKIRKYARPYTTGTLLSAYDETTYAKGRQVLGYALHGDVLFIWWNGVVSGTATETVTANRISDGARLANSGSLVPTSNYFASSGTHTNGFTKANGTEAFVQPEQKNLMSVAGGVLGILAGRSAGAGTSLHTYSVYTGEIVGEVSLASIDTSHKRYDLCSDVRGDMYAVTSRDPSGDSRIFKLSCHKAGATTVAWEVESTNTNPDLTRTGNMSSVSVDDWGDKTIVYVVGEGMRNSLWTDYDATNDYDASAATNNLHNLVLFNGEDGKTINGGCVNRVNATINSAYDVGGTAQITMSADHNLSTGDRINITNNTDADVDEIEGIRYVERINATTVKLFSGLTSGLGAPTGNVTTSEAGSVATTAKWQDVSEIGIARLQNGFNLYDPGYGKLILGWNRARNNFGSCVIPAGVRPAFDSGTAIGNSRIEGGLHNLFFSNSGSELQSDQNAACHLFAVRAGESGRESKVRDSLLLVSSGGKQSFFTKQGGFVGTIASESEVSAGGFIKVSNKQRVFFSIEHTRFVDGGSVKGPYSLICDGDSYRLVEVAPYNVFATTWVATSGTLPADGGNSARLIENWRGRIVLSGIRTDPSNWFMSAYGNPLDWDYFPSVTVETQAVAGNNSSAGKSPDIINSLVPYTDDLLLFGGDKTIWQMTGDPMSGGRLDRVSGGTGMAWGRAWTIAPDGTLFFFGSRGGVYLMVPSQRAPQRLGIGTLDYELTQINLLENTIRMEWSTKEEGLYLFVCPVSPTKNPSSYFWDSRSSAWWKDVFPQGMSPSYPVVLDGDEPGDREILIGASNGGIYSLSETAGDDDGTEISSHAFIGPITTGTDGMIVIDEMQYILPTSGNPVSYSIHTGDTVKGAVESSAFFTGNLVAGDNAADRRRIVGKNIFLKVHNKSGEKKPWSLEGVNVFAREIGAAAARTRK